MTSPRHQALAGTSAAAAFGLLLVAAATTSMIADAAPIATTEASAAAVDYDAVRAMIAAEALPDGKGGSYGPILLRLAWHTSGTWDNATKTGGSNGASMRFNPEKGYGANAGLAIARDRLEPVKAAFPGLSYGDLWTLAGVVAVKAMGGPDVPWYPGRTDASSGDACPPDGRLPSGSKGRHHLRDIFYRMGFDDQEIVALSGGHTVGRCHKDRSGFLGPWTASPLTFTNAYYRELLDLRWRREHVDASHAQYGARTEGVDVMMLRTDLALVRDDRFYAHVLRYAKDEALFFHDFAAAFAKLISFGVPKPSSSSLPGAREVASAAVQAVS